MALNAITTAREDARQHGEDGDLAKVVNTRLAVFTDPAMYLGELVAALETRWSTLKHELGQALAAQAEDDVGLIRDAEANAKDHATDQNNRDKDLIHGRSKPPVYNERYVWWMFQYRREAFQSLAHDPADGAAETVGEAIARAERDGLIPSREILALQPKPAPGAPASSDTVDPTAQILHSTVAHFAAVPTMDLEGKFKQAQKHLAELDAQLETELHEIGPALWDPNETDPAKLAAANQLVQQYIKQYRRSTKYQTALNNVNALAAQLKIDVDNQERTLVANARDGDAGSYGNAGRETVVDSYQALATTESSAQGAALWAAHHANDTDFTEKQRQKISQIGTTARQTDAYYQVQQLQAIMTDRGEPPDSRLAKALDWIDDHVVKPYKDIDTVIGVSQLGMDLKMFRTNIKFWRARDAKTAQKIAEQFIAEMPKNADTLVQRVWSGFGILAGMADVGNAGLTGNVLDLAGPVADLYDRLNSFKTAVSSHKLPNKEAEGLINDIHGRFVTLEGSFALLGAVGAAMDVKGDLDAMQTNSNIALKIKLVGDISSTVGTALLAVPGLEPEGLAITAVGSIVSLIAGAFVGNPGADARRRQEDQLLNDVHAFGPHSGTLAAAFTHEHSAGNLAAAEAAGLTTDEIHTLGKHDEYLFENQNFIRSADDACRFFSRDDVAVRMGFQLATKYRNNLMGFLGAVVDRDRMRYALAKGASSASWPKTLPPPDTVTDVFEFLTELLDALKAAMKSGTFVPGHG